MNKEIDQRKQQQAYGDIPDDRVLSSGYYAATLPEQVQKALADGNQPDPKEQPKGK